MSQPSIQGTSRHVDATTVVAPVKQDAGGSALRQLSAAQLVDRLAEVRDVLRVLHPVEDHDSEDRAVLEPTAFLLIEEEARFLRELRRRQALAEQGLRWTPTPARPTYPSAC